MFTKIDKKILAVLVIVLVLVLGAGVFTYKALVLDKKSSNSSQDSTIQQETNQEPQQNNAPIIDAPKIELKTGPVENNQEGSLFICADKCGDKICQKAGENCVNGDSLNCACAETVTDCPQDCPAN